MPFQRFSKPLCGTLISRTSSVMAIAKTPVAECLQATRAPALSHAARPRPSGVNLLRRPEGCRGAGRSAGRDAGATTVTSFSERPSTRLRRQMSTSQRISTPKSLTNSTPTKDASAARSRACRFCCFTTPARSPERHASTRWPTAPTATGTSSSPPRRAPEQPRLVPQP